jgi:hypothetical protein
VHSFLNSRGQSQAENFRGPLARIMNGDRVGQAMDEFNGRWCALSSELLRMLRWRDQGKEIADAKMATAWVARDDARDYIVSGINN